MVFVTIIDMQSETYRKNKINLLLLMLLTLFTSVSCSKAEDIRPPFIEFVNDSGYISHDTVLPAGARISVLLNAEDMDGNITFLEVIRDNGTRQIFLDSGMNCQGFNYKLTIIKSNDPLEKWIFKVMDRERNIDSLVLKLERSANNQYGNIKSMENITLSAQNVNEPGSFFSLSTGKAYNLDTAFTKQSITDIIYYFSEYESTLSSPNESDAPVFFPGPFGIANWSIKRETRYDTTLVTASQFEMATNDSLLLASYDPANGKRKLKYAVPGMVISFTSPDGKIGLLYLQETVPGAEGYIKFSIKVQE